jgi:hypothetical protein
MEFILFFFFPPAKEERNPTHIAHIAKATRANAQTKALPKSAILPTHRFVDKSFIINLIKSI